jgi:hypothetical protein
MTGAMTVVAAIVGPLDVLSVVLLISTVPVWKWFLFAAIVLAAIVSSRLGAMPRKTC